MNPRSSSKDIAGSGQGRDPRGSSQKQKEDPKKKNSFSGQRESAGHPSTNAPTLAKDVSRGRLRPNDLNSNGSNINIRNVNSSVENNQLPPQKGLTKKGEHVSSSSSIKTLEPINPPLNSYAEFANVFTVKGMGRGSKSRKHAKF